MVGMGYLFPAFRIFLGNNYSFYSETELGRLRADFIGGGSSTAYLPAYLHCARIEWHRTLGRNILKYENHRESISKI